MGTRRLMADLPVHAVVRVVVDLPYDERRLLWLYLVPKELELLHQLVHVDLAITLLIHPLERAPQALQLLRLLELSSLTLSPLLLIVRLHQATRARETADKHASRGRFASHLSLGLIPILGRRHAAPRQPAPRCCEGKQPQKPPLRPGRKSTGQPIRVGRKSRVKTQNNGRKRRAGTLPLVPPRATASATRARTGKGHEDHGEEVDDVRAIYFCFARRQVACLPRRLPPRLGLGAGRGGLCLRGGRVPVLPDPVPRPPGPAPPRNPLI